MHCNFLTAIPFTKCMYILEILAHCDNRSIKFYAVYHAEINKKSSNYITCTHEEDNTGKNCPDFRSAFLFYNKKYVVIFYYKKSLLK